MNTRVVIMQGGADTPHAAMLRWYMAALISLMHAIQLSHQLTEQAEQDQVRARFVEALREMGRLSAGTPESPATVAIVPEHLAEKLVRHTFHPHGSRVVKSYLH